MSIENTRSKWGRGRFGGSTSHLMAASLTVGVLVSAALGWLFMVLRNGDRPLLAFGIMAVFTLPIAAVLAWVVLVDRSTVAGALDKPEDSVESVWYDKAASGAFTDILLVGGLGCAALTFLGTEATAGLVLGGVVAFAMLDFGARYLWQKKTAV
ncbi:hypothetical protein ITX31_14415 [Arthrobacter gandavensis]|uniref:hypothetical protein n=1 Tax=Arthrobacter gandavensis TaxID=169960 RepID=UPI00188EB6FB|nr:hypothetical protein [Arthrobacter gandavensis]MBF4995298.1 hypothetical protein [Arthrobacter gandavensis]